MEQEEQLQQEGAENEEDEENPEFNADDLVDSDVDTSLAMVVRPILAAPKIEKEDWRRTTIFQTLVTCGKELRKLVIDGGSCMNVVSASTVERLKLPTEPHPQPYHVAWINKTTIPVTQRCLVSIASGHYKDSIWCDVVPTKNVKHILYYIMGSTLAEALIFLRKYPLLIQLTALLVGRWLDDCLSVAFPGAEELLFMISY